MRHFRFAIDLLRLISYCSNVQMWLARLAPNSILISKGSVVPKTVYIVNASAGTL